MVTPSAQQVRPDDDRALPVRRACSRCDGDQELVASHGDFGKYLCDDCGMSVGVDLAAEPPEFKQRVARFLDGLISHLVLDGGNPGGVFFGAALALGLGVLFASMIGLRVAMTRSAAA